MFDKVNVGVAMTLLVALGGGCQTTPTRPINTPLQTNQGTSNQSVAQSKPAGTMNPPAPSRVALPTSLNKAPQGEASLPGPSSFAPTTPMGPSTPLLPSAPTGAATPMVPPVPSNFGPTGMTQPPPPISPPTLTGNVNTSYPDPTVVLPPTPPPNNK
jgi:hypothetical protein